MELTTFLGYLQYRECVEIDRRRLYYVYTGPDNNKPVQVPRNMEYLERETISLVCADLGSEMPDKFRDFEARMKQVWPSRS